MKTSEIRELSLDEVRDRVDDAREEYMKLRFQQATGELTDTNRIRIIKRDIARLLTVLRELEAQEGE